MIQLDPMNVILVICHTDNTCDKSVIRDEHLSYSGQYAEKMKETNYQIYDIVKDPKLLQFYLSL